MRKTLYLFILLSSSFLPELNAQQQLSYAFGESPHTLMLNPGAETNFQYHFGLPVLSNFDLNVGVTGFTLEDLFLADNLGFDGKFRNTLDQLDSDDYININAKIDVLNGGYRYDDKTYLSFGFYEEIDIIAYIPKDITELFYYGNSNFTNRSFSFSQLNLKADLLGILHAGISRKVNKRLNIGGRVKIYSSSLSVQTRNNSGTLTTTRNDQNIFRQSLNNINVNIQTSGLIGSDDKALGDSNKLLSKTFLGGNLGLGFDFGLTYHVTPQLEFSASILDLGFVRHSKNTRNYSVKGDYVFDGIEFEFDPANPRDYWQELEDDFDDKVPSDETQDPYTSWRPVKLNAALKYSFGDMRTKRCFTETYKRYYYNAIGFQVHTIMRPLKPQFSFTSFFETSLTEKIHTKFTHTVNDYSATILGSGMTFQWGNVNVFGLVDNMLGVRDLGTASNIIVNFGVTIAVE